MKKTMLLACLASTISTGLIADDYADFETFLGAGHYKFDSERNLDNATSLELGVEVPMSEAISLEAWFTSFDADVENSSSEVDGTRYNLGGLYHFSNDSLRPFMSLGLGHNELEDSANNSHSEAVAYVGAGLKKYFDNNIVLRGEVLALNSLDNEVTDLGARLAIGYAFGRDVSAPVVMAEPTPVKKAVVKAKPVVVAPAPKPAAKAAPAPKPVVVAPLDTDNDGVIDSLDKCKATDKALKVDKDGCPIMMTETVSIDMNVKFPSNSAVINESSYTEIKKVADFMTKFPKSTVNIEGYTDDRGRAEYNKSLSQKRSDAVRMTLINTFKLDEKRVSATGYGEVNPIADNNTAAGRAENRRVVGVVKSSFKKAAIK